MDRTRNASRPSQSSWKKLKPKELPDMKKANPASMPEFLSWGSSQLTSILWLAQLSATQFTSMVDAEALPQCHVYAVWSALFRAKILITSRQLCLLVCVVILCINRKIDTVQVPVHVTVPSGETSKLNGSNLAHERLCDPEGRIIPYILQLLSMYNFTVKLPISPCPTLKSSYTQVPEYAGDSFTLSLDPQICLPTQPLPHALRNVAPSSLGYVSHAVKVLR
jgi:hypothetical protein